MRFRSELCRGNLVVPVCDSCKKTVWPPSDFCSYCLADTVWEAAPRDGIILEFSRQGGRYFCVAELGRTLRLVCSVASGTPENGRRVRLERCGIRDGSGFFEVRVLE